MSTTQELIERLYADVMYDAFGDVIVPSVLTEAADRLASLSAENAALKAKLAGVDEKALRVAADRLRNKYNYANEPAMREDEASEFSRAAIAAYLAALGGK